MRIDINDKYCITSDPRQFIINTKGIIKTDREGTEGKEGVKAGDEYLAPIAYPSTLKGCFRELLLRQVRVSDACGFKAVMAEIERIEKELKEAIKI